MQGLVSDKTFHLKWNNHLQNLSQLFTTIYSSSALADVTLSCRDGTLKAHKLVLSACSPYFEQIFKDNPCQHPIVILKGIPFSEINLLVEFMYKGSVDVQELDLQSLMHTASELEIRGLAYEARDNAAQMLNVNLEYPTYSQQQPQPVPTPTPAPQSYPPAPARTDVERLKQIHMYQQSMMRAEEIRRRRRDDPPTTHTAVNNILAAAAREMEEARRNERSGHMLNSEMLDQDINNILATAAREMEVARKIERPSGAGYKELERAATSSTPLSASEVKRELEDDRPKKRPCIMSPDDDKLRQKKKMTVRFQEDSKPEPERQNKVMSPGPANNSDQAGGIKVVQLSMLQRPTANNDHDDSDGDKGKDDEEETDSGSDSVSDSAQNDNDNRPHVCDVCDLRFQRSSHLSRHKLTHTGERPFTCGGCGRSFARSDKLRVHVKICEREDPTVDMTSEGASNKRDKSSVMSGMVRTTHRESGHLVFTPGGDVMLPPRAPPPPPDATAAADQPMSDLIPRRGRGRPRKTPIPMTPKIKKRRGRPPKMSLDMEGCVLTSGSVLPSSPSAMALTPSGQQLLLKRKRGRPPKNYILPRPGMDFNMTIPMDAYGLEELRKFHGRPNENYNATNLPFGDFSYLTEMMYNPMAYSYGVTSVDPDRNVDADHTMSETSHDRAIDVSDSSSDDDDSSRIEPEQNVPPVAVETQIMTVGDCQIVKLPPNNEEKEDKQEQPEIQVQTSTPGSVTITPITTVGDCTIRPVENSS